MSKLASSAATPAQGAPLPAVKANPYDKIREAIVSGDLNPGQPLVESALATWCGVSRTPVREALQRLEQDGLVAWSERGLVVRDRSPEEILDIYEVRTELEAASARTAADRRTDRDLQMLRAALALGDSVDPTKPDELVRYSRNFHLHVQRAAHNEALSDLLDRVNLHLSRYSGTQPTLAAPGRWQIARVENAALVDAIEKRDAELAHRINHAHFSKARDIRLAMFSTEFTQ